MTDKIFFKKQEKLNTENRCNEMNILLLLSGLALFLLGMNIMGDSLEKISGGRLESVLEKMTNKQYKGVLLGAGVTAVTQSSSAVTVMVVGFVNSGIMRLSRAVSIIMGANIGTTFTAWVLSLAGISSDNFFVQLFKPATFAPVLAVIGVFLLLFAKSEKPKNTGAVLAGFSVLMLGMGNMSSAMSTLADSAEFSSLLIKFSNPVLGIIAGALLTAVIQSSSASVGILQALSLTGSVSFLTAFPIILGQNIGTCATTLISSVGTSKNAKRAAFVHLYFNLIGVALAMALFYGANAIFSFDFAQNAVSPFEIAIIHSVFNIFATLLLLPFSKQLERLAVKTVKSGNDSMQDKYIDENLFISPSYTIEKCRELGFKMADSVNESAALALEMVNNYSDEGDKRLQKLKKQIDEYEEILKGYIIRISRESISKDDSKKVFLLFQAVEDFAKAADYSMKIAAAKKKIKDIALSESALGEIDEIGCVLKALADVSTGSFRRNDAQLAKRAAELEDSVDSLHRRFKSLHVARLESGECSAALAFKFSEIISGIEHIADHFAAVSLAVIEVWG
ncbi:MAG: Na/Pi cotransporter family protein [Clostridiales bacterium]|nr:Na/Pi cotransporter family protein [Clostridiales bacterium]